MGLEWIVNCIAIISLNRFDKLIFVMATHCFFTTVETEILNFVYMSFGYRIIFKNPSKIWQYCLLFNKIMWDFKFSRRRVWCSELSSGMYCRVKWLSTIILHGSTSQKTILNKITKLYLYVTRSGAKRLLLFTVYHLLLRVVFASYTFPRCAGNDNLLRISCDLFQYLQENSVQIILTLWRNPSSKKSIIFSPCRKENSNCLHYKHQLITIVWGNNNLFLELCKTQIYNVVKM
jgi:hypothetical protein